MKKTILSIVAMATLSTMAFGETSENVWDILAKNPDFVKTVAVPTNGGMCIYTNQYFTSKTEEQAMKYMKGYNEGKECSVKVFDGGLKVSCENTNYYFFISMDICEQKLKILKGGK